MVEKAKHDVMSKEMDSVTYDLSYYREAELLKIEYLFIFLYTYLLKR